MNLVDLEVIVKGIAEELDLDVDVFEIPGGIDDANDKWQEKVEEVVGVWASKHLGMKPSSMSTEKWVKGLVSCEVLEDSGSLHMYNLLCRGTDLPWEGMISSLDLEKDMEKMGEWFSLKLGKEYRKFQKQLVAAAYEGCMVEEESDTEDDGKE